MILKSLYDYYNDRADKLPAIGTELKEIPYVIVIDKDGRFIRFESKRIDKRRCATFSVAKTVSRTSAPKPNILWDNGKYVLGLEESHNRCHELFVEKVREIASRHPEDISIQALVKFYNTPASALLADISNDQLYGEIKDALSMNFSFQLEGDDCLIAEKPHLFMDIHQDDDGEPEEGRCLVTGVKGPIIRTFSSTPLPGNSPMAALVSFQVNSGYDSYNKKQAYNAPISVDAEAAITAALKNMLDKNSQNKAGIGNRTFLFWGSGNSDLSTAVEESMSWMLNINNKADNPDEAVGKVTKLFKSIYSGQIKTTLDDRFHILGMAPCAGRIAVVLWMDTELKNFAEKIYAHFNDMEMADTRKPEDRKPYFGVYSMVSAVTRGGKLSDALPNLVEGVTDAIINGTPYPMTLYAGALERIRNELNDRTVTLPRAAILKAHINRSTKHSTKHKPLQPMLDKTNDSPGYLCGRLTAVLEKIQHDTESGDSIRTRYMGAASATPSTVFPAMLNVSIHHSEKLSKEQTKIFFEQLKQEIIGKLPVDGFPSHLDLHEQGRFFVGYYHQRADLYTKKDNNEQE